MTTPKLSALMRRLETTKARANKIEESKPQETDRMIAAAINGMKDELRKTTEEAEALKAEAESVVEESKKEVAAVHAAMENLRRETQQHVESILAQAEKERKEAQVVVIGNSGAHQVKIDAMQLTLTDALTANARLEAECNALKKANAALEKKLAAKPAAQPVIMPAAPKPVVDHIDAVVTQRDLNGRVAGVRFTPGKS